MPDITIKKRVLRNKRRKHIRKTILGSSERPRLVVFKSNKHIYAQLIDDVSQTTITAASTLTKEIAAQLTDTKSKIGKAAVVGEHVAKLATDKKISKIVFDRAGYLYHGRVKALADGARKGGLEF